MHPGGTSTIAILARIQQRLLAGHPSIGVASTIDKLRILGRVDTDGALGSLGAIVNHLLVVLGRRTRLRIADVVDIDHDDFNCWARPTLLTWAIRCFASGSH